MTMHIDIQSTKFIKPVTSTPNTDLHHYKISSIDELYPELNVRVALFFSVDDNHSKFVSQLENSLEKTLSRFYPLAGGYLKELHVVDCNDQGVEFKHANTNIKLEQILDPKANLRLIDEFMPCAMGAHVDEVTEPILSVQLTSFMCGGVALAVSVSHRIVDASTLCTFLNHWASINRQEENDFHFINGPGFNSPSFFPARGISPVQVRSNSSDEMIISKIVTKRLFFRNDEISKLKEKTKLLDDTQHWSRVQILSALLSNILIEIDRRTLGHPRDSFIIHLINLRGKTETLIPRDSCGNLCWLLATKCESSVETTQALAHVIRDSIKNAIHCYSKLRLDNEEGQTMVLNSYLPTIPSTANIITFTSWLNFPFYKADFGFGKPVWVNRGSVPDKNSVFVIDSVEGNGVEAFVGLQNTDVPYFEEALKAFAT